MNDDAVEISEHVFVNPDCLLDAGEIPTVAYTTRNLR